MAVRRQINYIYLTIVCCCFSITICGVSLGTEHWYNGLATTANSAALKIEINYGLFKGSKIKSGGGDAKTLELTGFFYAFVLYCLYCRPNQAY